MKLYRLFIEGGPYQLTIVSLWALLMILVLILKIMRMVKRKEYDLKQLNYILVFGAMAMISGILAHLIGLYRVMGLIGEVGDISLSLFAKGYQLSLISPVYGLIIFAVAFISWGVLKEINLRKMG